MFDDYGVFCLENNIFEIFWIFQGKKILMNLLVCISGILLFSQVIICIVLMYQVRFFM